MEVTDQIDKLIESRAKGRKKANAEAALERAADLEGGRELFVRDLELFSRGRALVVSLEELAGEGERDRESVRRIISNGHR